MFLFTRCLQTIFKGKTNEGFSVRHYIGSCPALFYGGCHGKNEREVFKELCSIIAETDELDKHDGKLLPEPLSGKEFVNALQRV